MHLTLALEEMVATYCGQIGTCHYVYFDGACRLLSCYYSKYKDRISKVSVLW